MPLSQQKILIAGGAGYIGSHMVKHLLDRQYGVIVLDDLSTGFRQLAGKAELITGRIGDTRLLTQIFSQHKIAAVMHFAAFSQVGESVASPLKYYRNNISETLSLIETMVRAKIDNFIFSSSAAVYGEPEATPINEAHPCRPTNPYGETKLCIERLLAGCDTAHGLKSICLRYFNAAGADPQGTIGEMHNPETHLIPLVLQSAISGKPVKVFGTDYATPDGTCIRDYVHVTDLAQAHLLALTDLLSNRQSRIYNLGNSTGYSVRQVIEAARRVTGKKIVSITEGRRPGDPATLVADAARIKRELGWQPVFEDLETIIETAWRWETGKPSMNAG
jgi:UDP-glucose 4-epimerase